MATERTSQLSRKTGETEIELRLALDGTGEALVETGVPFFDHMLSLFARHGLFDLQVKASGDVEVDYHHMVEDVGILLGDALKEAVGSKAGMVRYGWCFLPMDETLVRVALDFGGRPYLVYQVESAVRFVRDFNVALFREFFQGLVNHAGLNLHLRLEYGEEPHHIAEACFKGFARALDAATALDPRRGDALPTTKGLL